jgi:antitoxin (DNA-binding transcriptional repressor) of toxin-antitoxin stability system
MKASVVDLRYRMNDVLKALNRNEPVTILYHGKVKGTIVPKQGAAKESVREHAFFRMHRESASVEDQMSALRGGRHRDL